MVYAPTAPNIRYTLRRSSGLASEKPQSAYGLCAFFLRHIFAVAGMLRIPLSQLQKRRIAFMLCEIPPGNIRKYLNAAIRGGERLLTYYE
jgi:hypothetical protein